MPRQSTATTADNCQCGHDANSHRESEPNYAPCSKCACDDFDVAQKQASFTPGPWHYSGVSQADGSESRYEVGAIHGQKIARLDFTGSDDVRTGRQYHNARLIAAAPALYQAVRNMLAEIQIYRQQLYGNSIEGPVQIDARAALALVDGGSR
jgi:hypothetical protein